MAKRRGGQKKHWAEAARVHAWYAEVKRSCRWSDYELDYEFAWTEEGSKSRSTDQRPRTFEWIRKAARKPAGRDKRWRGMSELVVAVDVQLEGTKALYDAEIWDLLQETAPTLDIVQDRIDRLLQENRLERVSPGALSPTGAILFAKFGRVPLFDRCLQISLREMDRFSALALVWSLYQQTEPPHNWDIRALLESIADKMLDNFFADYLPDQHLMFYTNAIDVLIRTRMDLTSRRMGGYGFLDRLTTWPVVPQALVGKLTENDLSPVAWVINSGKGK